MIAPVYTPTDQHTRIAELEQALAELEQALAEEQALRIEAEEKMLALIDAVERPDRLSPRTLLIAVFAYYCSYFGQPLTRQRLAQNTHCSPRTIARCLAEYPDLASFLEPDPTELSHEPAQAEEKAKLASVPELARVNLASVPEMTGTKLASVPELAKTNLTPVPELAKTKLPSQINQQGRGASSTIQRGGGTADNVGMQLSRANLPPVAHAEERIAPRPPMANPPSQHASSSGTYNYNNLEATNRQNGSNSNTFNNLLTTNNRSKSPHTNSSQRSGTANQRDELARFIGHEKKRRIVQPEAAQTALSSREQEQVRSGPPIEEEAPCSIYQCLIDHSCLMLDYGPDAEYINFARVRAYYDVAVPERMTHEQFYTLMQEASMEAARYVSTYQQQIPNSNAAVTQMKIFWKIFESLLGFKLRKGKIEPVTDLFA